MVAKDTKHNFTEFEGILTQRIRLIEQ